MNEFWVVYKDGELEFGTFRSEHDAHAYIGHNIDLLREDATEEWNRFTIARCTVIDSFTPSPR